jgi:hypothetical protein
MYVITGRISMKLVIGIYAKVMLPYRANKVNTAVFDMVDT